MIFSNNPFFQKDVTLEIKAEFYPYRFSINPGFYVVSAINVYVLTNPNVVCERIRHLVIQRQGFFGHCKILNVKHTALPIVRGLVHHGLFSWELSLRATAAQEDRTSE